MKKDRIFTIVLAAGASRRFGGDKQLAAVDGEPLVHRAARIAGEVGGQNSMLVVGHNAQSVIRAADDGCRFLAVNEGYARGMGTSLALAARTLRYSASAMLVILADQPMVTSGHLTALIDSWSGAEDQIVATSYRETRGVPALLPPATFPALCKLDGDAGARTLFSDKRFQVRELRFEAAALDIDTADEWRALS